MKLTKKFTIKSLITLLSLIFIGISFADFYVITTTGSVIDVFTGEFLQTVEMVNNSYTSVACAVLPLVSLLFKRKWINVFAILLSMLNFLIIVILYPTSISATSLIGSSYSVELTWLGWIGAILVLLITFLFVINMIYKRKEKRGGTYILCLTI